MKVVVFLASILLATCALASGKPGVYVNHGADFAQKLELTYTKHGPIKVLFVAVRITPDGNLSSDQASTIGTLKDDRLVLRGNAALARFFGAGPIAGQKDKSAIRVQVVDDRGSVSTAAFTGSTAMLFQDYVNQLKCKSRSMLINAKLAASTKQFRQITQSSKDWIARAQPQVNRVPDAQAAYIRIEDKMRLAILKEAALPTGSGERAELLAAVNKAAAEGTELDNSLNQQWDVELMQKGEALEKEFSSLELNCGDNDAVVARRKQGANDDISVDWKCACEDAKREREEFHSAYSRIKQQREDQKKLMNTVQSTAAANRKALVEEAGRTSNAEGQ